MYFQPFCSVDECREYLKKFLEKFDETEDVIYLRWLHGIWMNLLEDENKTGLASYSHLFLISNLLQLVKTSSETDAVQEVTPGIVKQVCGAASKPNVIHKIRDLVDDGLVREIQRNDNTFQYRLTENGEILLELLKDIVGDVTTSEEEILARIDDKVLREKIAGLLPRLTEMDCLHVLRGMQCSLEIFDRHYSAE
jgi:DNA-binding transcriptional ArsR family regulator